MLSQILFAVQATVPNTGSEWNWNSAPIITASCLLCLFILPRVIEEPHVGQKMPLQPFSSLFNNPSVGTFIACMAAGHVIGIPVVLGLRNLGII